MKIRPFTFLVLLISSTLFTVAQSNISGVVNQYTSVSAVQPQQQMVQVTQQHFQSGDLVLLIQMQGATIDETLTNNFGRITQYNGAGNYELHRICRINGNEIYFQNGIQHEFNTSGGLQLVKVPEYNGAQLSGDLTGQAWDGSTGGVMALKVSGALNLRQYKLDMSGKGFRGGAALPSGGGCVFISLSTQYSDKNSANDRAHKGEGIAAFIDKKECSRGPQANGGGGGNNHNGGGSGGANYGVGGEGGMRVKSSNFTCGSVTGLPTQSVASEYRSSNSRVFMGGGGGAGHGNNTGLIGESGENGGGIIFVICDTLMGLSTNGIYSNGNSATQNAESEGGGGGGAGGSIIITTQHLATSINASAEGGTGVSVDNIGPGNCSGPGGGGGGGLIAISLTGGNNLNTDVVAGSSGRIASSAQSGCNIGDRNGAKDGQDGGTITGFQLNDFSSVLPTTTGRVACNKLLSPSKKYLWTTSGTYQDTLLNVAGCDSIITFNLIVQPIDTSVNVEGNTLISNAQNVVYQWIDCTTKQPVPGAIFGQFTPTQNGNYAVVVLINACSDTSKCYSIQTLAVQPAVGTHHSIEVFPNPSHSNFTVVLPGNHQIDQIDLIHLNGTLIQSYAVASINELNVSVEHSGVYFLRMTGKHYSQTVKIVRLN